MESFANPEVSDQLRKTIKSYIDEKSPVRPKQIYEHVDSQNYAKTEVHLALRSLAHRVIITHPKSQAQIV